MTPNPQPSVPVAPMRLMFEDSLLLPYIRDRFNDGTYTLHLNESKTRELWDAVDAQTLQLALLKSRETALRDALETARSFIEELRVPQDVLQAARQIKAGGITLDEINAVLGDPPAPDERAAP